MRARSHPPRLLALLALGLLLGGCVDLRSFAGSWSGGVVVEEPVRQGFGADTQVSPLALDNLDLRTATAVLTTSDGAFKQTHLTRVTKLANDALASLTFDGSPLRSYVFFAPLASDPTGAPALLLISLFSDDHVELRVLRGNDLYGLFLLHRAEGG